MKFEGVKSDFQFFFKFIFFLLPSISACTQKTSGSIRVPQGPYSIGKMLVHDSFETSSSYANWEVEAEESLEPSDLLKGGDMELNVAKGITVWHTQKFGGNVLIEFDATVVDKGGSNDRVSDLNCFWMATDPQHPDNFFARRDWRSGTFWKYYSLNLYYVGLGGHDNTKTRFRKYNGLADPQPEVLKEYTSSPFLIKPNKKCKIQIVNYEGLVRYFYNGEKLFELEEDQGYQEGYFGFRTVKSHILIHQFIVYRLE